MKGSTMTASGMFRSARRAVVVSAGIVVAALSMSLTAPTSAQAVGAGEYEKYPWSDTVFVTTSQWAAKAITYPEWAAAGMPTPRVGLVTGSHVVNYLTNPSDVFIGPWAEDGFRRVDDRRVTYAQWQSVGSPTPKLRYTGFIKTASSPDIYVCSSSSTFAAYRLTYDGWLRYGSPTPVVVPSITNRCP